MSVLLAATALSGLAGAAEAATYKGKTKQNRPIKFKVKKGKVRAFVGGITLSCFEEGTPTRTEFNAIRPPKAIRIKKERFKYQGTDKAGTGTIYIKGKIKGKKASGRMWMTHNTLKSFPFPGHFELCSAKTKWKARAR